MTPNHFTLTFALLAITLGNHGFAQTVMLPVASQGQHIQHIHRPRLGQEKNVVINQFGKALKRHAPMGTPAITRWDYPQFSVYFENNVVIHSVLKHQQLPSKQP